MAEKILSGKIKQLVYTTEELSQEPLSSTVIDNGILVYEKTSSGQIKCKMGDGNNVWSGLNYIEDSDKMDKNNPTGTGSLSINRAEGSTVGTNSIVFGTSCQATEDSSYAEGVYTTASANRAHAEGFRTTASGDSSHSEGGFTKASGDYSHAEGYSTTASGYASHAEGYETESSSDYQHVQGKYNIEDSSSNYAHIVGGGTSDTNRKNIHTLDWNGNAVFAGDVTATDSNGNTVSLLNSSIRSDTILGVSNGGTGYNTITDTTYTTARYRASSLNSSETTPTENGVIAWTYE